VWKSHLFLIPLHLLGLLGFYSIAKRLTGVPLLASFVYLFTPNYYLTSQSLLVDSLLAPVTTTGLALWISGQEGKNRISSFAGMVFLSFLPLIKYTGVIGVAAAFFWTLSQRGIKRNWRSLIYFLLPIFSFFIWFFTTRLSHGESHFIAVASDTLQWPSISHWIQVFGFLAGTAPVLIAILLIHMKSKPVTIFYFFILIGVILPFSISNSLPLSVNIQSGTWAALGIIAVGIIVKYFVKEKELRWLVAWLLIGLVIISVARKWVCARYFVIVTPALIVLAIRFIEKKGGNLLSRPIYYGAYGLVLTGFSLILSMADYTQASLYKEEAQINSQFAGSEHSTQGRLTYPASHLSGLAYYLDNKNWIGVANNEDLKVGDIFIYPAMTLPKYFMPKIKTPAVIREKIYLTWNPVRTFGAYSGYYGSIWGPLPFSVSLQPLEKIYLLREEG
jgi:hypothetical protein